MRNKLTETTRGQKFLSKLTVFAIFIIIAGFIMAISYAIVAIGLYLLIK